MQVTHEKAHRLIHYELDAALQPDEKRELSDHLEHCSECRLYAKDMQRIDGALSQMRNIGWSRQPAPLSIPELGVKSRQIKFERILLVMRTTVVALVFAAVAFNAWHFFSVSIPPTSSPAPVGILPAPTPSLPSTSTSASMEACKMMLYAVQEHDTVASIATQFSVTEEDIRALNNLRTVMIAATELWIPVCNFTPTGTVEGPATLTKASAPILRPTTSTPDG